MLEVQRETIFLNTFRSNWSMAPEALTHMDTALSGFLILQIQKKNYTECLMIYYIYMDATPRRTLSATDLRRLRPSHMISKCLASSRRGKLANIRRLNQNI